MDKLAPKLIRRAMKKDYLAIIIDPIYKVITGDENSADQMAKLLQPVRQGMHGIRLCGNLLPPSQQGQSGKQAEHGPGQRQRCVCP